jgi:nucleoside-diphosphate-sugar epimerase
VTKVVVTGASGFLGGHLLKKLKEKGYELIIVKRENVHTKAESKTDQKIQYISIGNIETVLKSQKPIDVVLHLAALYENSDTSISQICEANLTFAVSVLDAALALGTKRFISVGTALPKNINTYSLSKNQFSEWGELLAREGKIEFINSILHNIYGPGDSPKKFPEFIVSSCLKNLKSVDLTVGTQIRDFIYVDDVVNAYIVLIESTHSFLTGYSTIEIGSGEPISIKDFVVNVKRIAKSTTNFNFGSLPIRKNEPMRLVADTSNLIKLGWNNLTSIEDGLNKTIYHR